MLTPAQQDTFHRHGHVTVPNVFSDDTIAAAIADVESWGSAFLKELPINKRSWFVEGSGAAEAPLRKLDNPVYHREPFLEMARSPRLVSMVEQIIGQGVSVFFSQIFCKPPEVGGPKPIHQDNYYFGPNDPAATLTVWIALDAATPDNGCLHYGDGSHRGPLYDHHAPAHEPFNLQVSTNDVSVPMTPAPVPAGGVSLHHGHTLHQSSANTSRTPRRAAAFHYLHQDGQLTSPALTYDPRVVVAIS